MKSKFERKLEKVKELAIKENVPIIMDETLQKIKATLKELNKTTINKILEIGTATGYSALCFSELLTDNGEIDTIERDEERIAKAKENINILEGNKKINLYEGDAVEILKQMDNRYDLIFIDASKSKYPIFLAESLRMLNPNGIIFADNVLYKGYVMSDYNKHKQRTAVTHLREFIKNAMENEELHTEISEVGDGLAIIYRN